LDVSSQLIPGWRWETEQGARTSYHQNLSTWGKLKYCASPPETVAVLHRIFGDPALPHSRIISQLSSEKIIELKALARETNPELFYAGLIALAKRFASDGRPEIAAKIFSAMLSDEIPAEFQSQAKREWEVVSGRGPGRSEFLLSQLVAGSTDPRNIVPMCAASMIGRLARTVTAARFAELGAYAAEVPVFAGASYLLAPDASGAFSRHMAGAALNLGAIKIFHSGSIRFESMFRQPSKSLSLISRQSGLALGLMAASYAEARFGISEGMEAGAGELISKMIGLQVGARLGHAVLGPTPVPAPRDPASRHAPWLSEFFAENRAYAFPSGNRPLPTRNSEINSFRPMQMSGLRDDARISDKLNIITPGQLRVPASNERTRLQEKFRRLLPPEDRTTYSEEIILHLLNTPSELPGFHENMLNALARSPIAGSKAQYALAMNLEMIFSANALQRPTGSFQWTLWQYFMTRALKDSDAQRSQSALLSIFDLMERGPSRERLLQLQRSYGYGTELALDQDIRFSFEFWNRHLSLAHLLLKNYRVEDRGILLNAVHRLAGGSVDAERKWLKVLGDAKINGLYGSDLIDSVLNQAKRSPWGRLMINRMLQVFMVGDVAAKLKEMLPQDYAVRTPGLVEALRAQGEAPEAIAAQINGTVHTGFLDDLHLARKVVDVMLDSASYLAQPERREAAFDRLEKAFFKFARSGQKLTPDNLLELFKINPNPQADRLTDALDAGQVRLEIKSGAEFDAIVKSWGQAPETEVSLLLKEMNPGAPFRIVIRDLPALDLSTTSGEWQAFSEVMHRLKALSHEAGHYEDFSTQLDFRPDMSRHERYVSEAMALFTEFGFRVRNIDQWFWDQSLRMGESLGQYFRNLSDQSYFAHRNEQMLDGIKFFLNEGEGLSGPR